MVRLRRMFSNESNLFLESKKDQEELKAYLGDDLFDSYMKIRDRIPKDKAQYKDFSKLKKLPIKDIETFVNSFQSNTFKRKSDKVEGAKKYYEDSDWIVYRITSYPAAQLYGKDTKWCITGRYDGRESMGEEYFYGYIRDADLDGGYYFFIDKRNPKRKYCLLRCDNGNVHSIWSAEDVDFSDMDLADIPTDLPNGIDFWNDINTYIMEEAGKNSNITDFLLDEFEKDKKDWDVPLIKSYLQRLKDIDGEDLYLDDIYNRVFYDNNEDAFSFLINYNPPHSDDLGSVARRPSFLKELLKDIKENPDNYDEWYCTSLLEEILEYSDVSDKYFDSYLKTLISKIPNLNQFEFDTFISTFPIETLDNPNFLKSLYKSKDLDILTGIVSYITSSNSKDYEIGMRLLKSAIKAGADINGENSKIYEPIPWFYYILKESQYLTRQDIKWLLDNGAEPNIKDDNGNTASYYADEEFEDLFLSE